MKLLSITPTQLETDFRQLTAGVVASIAAVHQAAWVIRNENAKFWRLPTERLLAVLNDDVGVTLETFAMNTATGQAINGILDAINHPSYTGRVPVTMGRRDIAFNGTEFVKTALPDDGLDEWGNPLPEPAAEPPPP